MKKLATVFLFLLAAQAGASELRVGEGSIDNIITVNTYLLGGLSTLAVGTGSVQASNIISSPTALINFSSGPFLVRLTASPTAFIFLDYATVTVQGDVLLVVRTTAAAISNAFIGVYNSTNALMGNVRVWNDSTTPKADFNVMNSTHMTKDAAHDLAFSTHSADFDALWLSVISTDAASKVHSSTAQLRMLHVETFTRSSFTLVNTATTSLYSTIQTTAANLAAEGTINTEGNPVSWTKLIGVPAGFADGTDDEGSAGGGGGAGAIFDGTQVVAVSTFTVPGFPVIFDGSFASITVLAATPTWTGSHTFKSSMTYLYMVASSSVSLSTNSLVFGTSDYSMGQKGIFLGGVPVKNNGLEHSPILQFFTEKDGTLAATIEPHKSSFTIQMRADGTSDAGIDNTHLEIRNVFDNRVVGIGQYGLHIRPEEGTGYRGDSGAPFSIGISTLYVHPDGRFVFGGDGPDNANTIVGVGKFTINNAESVNMPIFTISTGGAPLVPGYRLFQVTGTSSTFKNIVYFTSQVVHSDILNMGGFGIANSTGLEIGGVRLTTYMSTTSADLDALWLSVIATNAASNLHISTAQQRIAALGIDTTTINQLLSDLSISTTIIFNQESPDISNRTYYLHSESSGGPNSYFLILSSPSSKAGVTRSRPIASADGLVLLSSHVTLGSDPGVRKIPAGIWSFTSYLDLSSIVGNTQLVVSVSTMDFDNGTHSEILSSTSTDLDDLGAGTRLDMSVVQQNDIAVATSTLLVVKYFARTTNVTGITFNFYYGGTSSASHLNTPIGNVYKFTQLADAPSTLLGSGGKYLSVNNDQTALVFVTTITDQFQAHASTAQQKILAIALDTGTFKGQWDVAKSSNDVDHQNFKAWFSTHSLRIDELQVDLSTHSVRIDELQADLSTHSIRIDELQADLSTTSIDIDALYTGVNSTNSASNVHISTAQQKLLAIALATGTFKGQWDVGKSTNDTDHQNFKSWLGTAAVLAVTQNSTMTALGASTQTAVTVVYNEFSEDDIIASTTVTTTETAFAKSYTFPANSLYTDQTYRVTLQFIQRTAASATTARGRIRFGGLAGTVGFDSTAFAPTSSQIGRGMIHIFTIRGVTAPSATGRVAINGNSGVISPSHSFNIGNTLDTPFTLDTTADQEMVITLQFGASQSGTMSWLHSLLVEKIP